jgi:acetoin utilization deacetylase AcuC-like enzyme
MSTLYITHKDFLGHEPGFGHPERPDRIRAVEAVLEQEKFALLAREQAVRAAPEVAVLAHPEHYVAALARIAPTNDSVEIDADTTMSPGTWAAVLTGVGAAVQATDEVLAGSARNAFCAIRPPGHHAESVRAMGFCFFNNAVIAARHAQSRHGIGRAAIIDFDVHHGNGSQEILWEDPSIMYCSTHQMPCYPGTGAASERGVGNIINCPLAPGDGSAEFREAFEVAILPALDRFAPEFVVISAGFDAHIRDPLANINLVEADFAWVTRRLMDVAERHSGGRVVSLLEGGYDLQGLARSVDAHVATLMQAG